MYKRRKLSLTTRSYEKPYPNIVHYADGSVSIGEQPAGTSTIEWEDILYDSEPSRPVYTSVLRSAFQWKARYGTPEAREQRLLALERRATLAHNRALRARYYKDLERYKTAVHRFGTYNPISGVVALGTAPIFRHCTNVQTTHKVVYSGSRIFVVVIPYGGPGAHTVYTTFDGPMNLSSPWFYTSDKDLVTIPGSFPSLSCISGTKVAQIISKQILNDTRLMNINGGAFSILTFLAELSDLKNLPALLKKWTRSSHDVSDKYLGVSFGVLPFYSDICAILDRLNNLPYAIEEWNRQADEAKVRSYHCTIDATKVGGPFNGSKSFVVPCKTRLASNSTEDVSWFSTVNLTQKVKIRGHVYLLPRRIDEGKISALKAHIWGTNSIFGTVWEKIPFSFVVDWFLHLGPIIQDLEEVDDLLSYRIIDAGYSVKVVSNWNTKQGSEPDCGDLFECESTNTRYERVPLSPKVFGKSSDEPFSITGLNISQSILSAALVHQQLKR